MNLQLNRIIVYLLSLILFLSFLGSSVHASSTLPSLESMKVELNDEENNKNLFVLKEGTDLSPVIEDIKQLDEHAKIDQLDEISILAVEASSDTKDLAIQELVKNKHQNVFEESGGDQSISVGDIQFESVSPILNKTQSFSTNTQTLVNEEESIYKKWNWDIEAVTQNGASRAIEEGNHDVKIGIIDSGIDFNHPDLKENIVSTGKSFIEGVTDTQDYLGHGTMVAGSIAANGSIEGISPNVGLVPYKVFHTGNADSSDVIEAIIAAANDHMDVINLSLGTYKSVKNKVDKAVYKAFERAVKYAVKEKSFVVASAGTELIGLDISNHRKLAEFRGYPGDSQHHMPGGLKDVYTIAATNKDGVLAEYSNYGENVSIGAPGGDYGPRSNEGILDIRYMTLTTYPTNLPQSTLSQYAGFEKGYEFMIGTSLAAPKVSATAALVIAQYEEEFGKKPSVKDIRKFLDNGAIKTESTKQFGAGIINAYESLKLVENKKK
ncbi:S8 family serine peptidase [Peribacillus simplex]|uniref:S8 family serine peptidase n=1 Tax=Peribacillus simplex TaxID=1478 RepID=UPI0033365419